MNKIISKQVLSSGIHVLDVQAEELVDLIRPGHFVFLIINPGDKRIVTWAIDTDSRRKTISIVFNPALQPQFVPLSNKRIGDVIEAISGPYGSVLPELEKQNILAVVQGDALVNLLSLGRYYKQQNSKVTGIVGLSTKKELSFESKLRVSCDKLFFTSLDGSYEKKGTPNVLLEEQIKKKPDFIYVQGDVTFSKNISGLLNRAHIEAKVNLVSSLEKIYEPVESSAIYLNKHELYPVVDGFILNSKEIDFDFIEKKMQQHEEYNAWVKLKSQSKAQPKESGILTRLFSGLTKETR